MKNNYVDQRAYLFEKTKLIVEKTEKKIIKFELLEGWFYYICKFIVFPYQYIKTGIGELLRPASVGVFTAFLLMLMFPMLISYFDVPKTYFSIFFNLIMLFPAMLVVFAVPSTYMSNGVKSEFVSFVVNELKSARFVDSDEVDLFESNLEKFSKRVETRITFYRWVVGVFWAIYLIIFNLNIRFITEQPKISIFDKIRENIFSFSLTLVAVFFCVVFILAYKRASELLFTTLEIGCAEYKYQLLQIKREEGFRKE